MTETLETKEANSTLAHDCAFLRAYGEYLYMGKESRPFINSARAIKEVVERSAALIESQAAEIEKLTAQRDEATLELCKLKKQCQCCRDALSMARETILNAGGIEDKVSPENDLRAEIERLKDSILFIRNELAAIVPVPSAKHPQWPDFWSDEDLACLTRALQEARRCNGETK